MGIDLIHPLSEMKKKQWWIQNYSQRNRQIFQGKKEGFVMVPLEIPKICDILPKKKKGIEKSI